MQFKRLRELRKKHGLFQKDIANILHCKEQVYQRYESGTRDIPISYAIILANYFEVSLDYITERSDNPNISK